MALLEIGAELFHDAAQAFRVLDQAVFFVHANSGQGGRTAHGVAVVGQPAKENFVLEVLGDMMPHADSSQGQIAARQSLSHAEQVGHNFPMVDRKPLAGAAEAAHNFVGDHQDTVLGAQIAHALNVALGRHEDSVGTRDGFQNESCDGVWTFELDGLLDCGQRRLGRFPATFDTVVGIHDAHYPRNAGLGRPAPRVACERNASRRRAVIRTIAGDDLVPPGKEAGNLDGILGCLSAAVGEEKRVNVARSDFRELGAQSGAGLGRHERISIGQRGGLLADGLDHPLIAMADVYAHQLAVEIDEALPFRRPEINTLGSGNWDRINLGLGRPFIQSVLFCEGDYFLAGHCGYGCSSRHKSPLKAATDSHGSDL